MSAPAAAARAVRLRAGGELRLAPAALAPLLSPYLAGGYRRDAVEIRELVLALPRLRATLDVTDFAMPGNGRYHFTALHALLCVCQVGVVAATLAHGLDAKPGEIYLRDFAIVCRREINVTRGLRLQAQLTRAQETPAAVLYALAWEYEAGAFTGTLRCLFPRAAPPPAAS